MKTLMIAIAMVATMSFTTTSAKAQIENAGDVVVAAGNLVAINVGDINVQAQDILQNILNNNTVVVDVSNVLNNNNVEVNALNVILKDIKIDNVLNNLLRDANVITGNQVVVGIAVNVLSGVTELLVANKKALK